MTRATRVSVPLTVLQAHAVRSLAATVERSTPEVLAELIWTGLQHRDEVVAALGGDRALPELAEEAQDGSQQYYGRVKVRSMRPPAITAPAASRPN